MSLQGGGGHCRCDRGSFGDRLDEHAFGGVIGESEERGPDQRGQGQRGDQLDRGVSH